jgi:ABC-type multidrug transport system fused ATPase/permease subunit
VVAEQGTHQELLALGGVYAELHRIQVEGVSETIAS